MSTRAVIAPVVRAVRVRRSQEEAFRIFTEQIGSWWPLLDHSVYGERAAGVAFLDGQIVETSDTGERCVWGRVTEWEPSRRLVFTWHPGYGDNEATTVEVVFIEALGGTWVELTHHGWEILGERAADARDSYDTGWPGVLDAFGVAAGGAA